MRNGYERHGTETGMTGRKDEKRGKRGIMEYSPI